jgi:hypothetical protein
VRTVVGRRAVLVRPVLYLCARDDTPAADGEIGGSPTVGIEIIAQRCEVVEEVIAAGTRVGVARLRMPVAREALFRRELQTAIRALGGILVHHLPND